MGKKKEGFSNDGDDLLY